MLLVFLNSLVLSHQINLPSLPTERLNVVEEILPPTPTPIAIPPCTDPSIPSQLLRAVFLHEVEQQGHFNLPRCFIHLSPLLSSPLSQLVSDSGSRNREESLTPLTGTRRGDSPSPSSPKPPYSSPWSAP